MLVHRASDTLHDLEREKGDEKLLVVKDLRGKTIKVGAQRVGYSLNGVWQWTQAAIQRYDTDELHMAGAYINGH